MSEHPVLFPLFLKLEGRLCLVVGGNAEVQGKIYGLLASGALVKIVSPIVTDEIRRLAVDQKVQWEARVFTPTDLENVTLVVANDDDDAVNELVYREATARGVLCNVVDQPERCHFYYSAVVRRGQLQIAVSTGGLSPALAKQIRHDLERQFEPAYADWLQAVGCARERILGAHVRSPRRTRLLQRIASKQAFSKFLSIRNKSEQEIL
ncbi:MAG TPA: bifunctional precorrin-2 dehydrogenase/sirohydrochlorin ferrochelatase [Terriglobales bacterium]|nr:bifunctional precorrin-2 dehydrogenase/sirohydrochlorin ferrochelatase [Terriglobales bacterium]